jgi:hypothetical protein
VHPRVAGAKAFLAALERLGELGHANAVEVGALYGDLCSFEDVEVLGR